MYTPPTIIHIGSQEVYDIGDRLRFVIDKVLPHKGYRFKFGIRDRILKQAVNKGKRLEVMFKEYPEMSFIDNPISWMNKGEEKSQVGYYKDQPMKFFWYKVNFAGEIDKTRVSEGQAVLF